MQKVGSTQIDDYTYHLPEERIAKFPLEARDQSKLLYLNQGVITEKKFSQVPELLSPGSLLVFNETKVIRARLVFRKPTGAQIEIFCLEPVQPSSDFQIAFQEKSPVIWKCMLGNAKRWKAGDLTATLVHDGQPIELKAGKVEKSSDAPLIEFSWSPAGLTFGDIIGMAGLVPLPPYLNREAVESDKERYQTVYARFDGSVAAPTAGLHFTEPLLKKISEKGIETAKVTLHVGAGTFKPVVSSTIAQHAMHTEKIVVSRQMLLQLLHKLHQPVIPVGTTSMRTLESLFWLGFKLSGGDETFCVNQWDPYELQLPAGFKTKDALEALLGFLEKKKLDYLKAETRLMIAPGYKFRMATGLITNFHQPKSTLLLLVSALVGDRWKTAYDFAMQRGFRFLSYGDSCLFIP